MLFAGITDTACHIHRVANNCKFNPLLTSHVSHNAIIIVDANTVIDRIESRGLPLTVPFIHPAMHHQGTVKRVLCIVSVRTRSAEIGHHGITNKFIDRTARFKNAVHRDCLIFWQCFNTSFGSIDSDVLVQDMRSVNMTATRMSFGSWLAKTESASSISFLMSGEK